jgi:hypothetical protein
MPIGLFELDAEVELLRAHPLEHPLAGEQIVGEVKDDEEDANDYRHHHQPIQHPKNRVLRLAAAEKADHSVGNGAAGPGTSAMPIS